MDIFLLIIRSLMILVGSLMLITFLIFQLWQRIPSAGLSFKTQDIIAFCAIGLIFALGANSYFGLLVLVPMFLCKLLSQWMIQKNRVRGSGRWIEVQWTKMTPRGFQMPQQLTKELQRLPGDQHILLPRQIGVWAVKYFLRSVKKNAAKSPVPMKAGQQAQAFEMVERLGNNIIKLEKGKTEQVALPFGVLKVTRL
jgi:hypothetical protein